MKKTLAARKSKFQLELDKIGAQTECCHQARRSYKFDAGANANKNDLLL